jgi:hypothetical protein
MMIGMIAITTTKHIFTVGFGITEKIPNKVRVRVRVRVKVRVTTITGL